MGIIRHHAIVVTGYGQRILQAYERATKLGLTPTNVIVSEWNGYESFMISPDGVKESLEESSLFDGRRALFKEYLKANHKYFLDWVEIRYGSDLEESEITDSAWGDH